MNLIRLGGVVTLAVMAGFVLLTRRRGTGTHAEGRAVSLCSQAFPCSPFKRPRWHRTSTAVLLDHRRHGVLRHRDGDRRGDLRDQVSRRQRRRRSARRSRARFRSSSAGRSSRSSSRWGSSSTRPWCSSRSMRPPAETMEIYSTGKRWMWSFQHLDGKREINELHVPMGRPVKRDVHVGGRAALAVFPGVPRQGRRDSRPLQLGVVRGHPDRRVPPLLRRVLRHQALRHDRQGGGDGAERLPGVAVAAATGSRWRRAASSCSSSSPASPATSTTTPGRGPSLAGHVRHEVELTGRRTVTVDDTYIRESILTPQMKIVAGYQPLMPTFQGLVNEEGVMSADRVHQVEGGHGATAGRRAGGRRAS